MTFLYGFMQPYMGLVYFFYGLTYFVTGLAIALQVRRSSTFKLARSLWILAAFALIHSLAEWEQAFINFYNNISPRGFFWLGWLEMNTVTVSFMFLLLFGVHLLSETRGQKRWFFLASLALPLVWIIISTWGRFTADNLQEWLQMSIVWARYLLALPGSLLTSFALRAQVPEIRLLGSPRAHRSCLLGSYTFIIYAMVAGLVGPAADFFPANLINADSFFRVTGIPVEVLRIVAGILMAFSMISLLSIFEAEYRHRLEEADKRQAILQERQRFGRDLHDGVIQSLYAIGLNLECCHSLLGTNQQVIGNYLTDANNKLNGTIRQLRNYIRDLQAPDAGNSLTKQLVQLANEFKGLSMSGISVTFEGPVEECWTPEQNNHIYHIVQEAMYNVIKHAGAGNTVVRVLPGEQFLTIHIIDDGKGFDVKETVEAAAGMGLANMRFRAAQLGGRVSVDSRQGQGTKVVLEIPYGGDRKRC